MPAPLRKIAAALACGALMLPHSAQASNDDEIHDEVMEEVLVEFWQFFKGGDVDKSGYIERSEFFAHPVYELAGWGEDKITFVFWMVDDDKDGKISLQEWFNNELGQFQLGDKNHDGVIDKTEFSALSELQQSLFRAMNFSE